MKKVGIVISEFYNRNRLFDPDDPVSNRDGCLHQWHVLRKAAEVVGIHIMTADMAARSEFDYLLYSDVSFPLPSEEERDRSLLLINESPLISPENWITKHQDRFAKIFTWNDALVDGKRYFKINPFPVSAPEEPVREGGRRDGFCVMIAGNKRNNGNGELYSERLRAIRWFERFAPEDFDLYGIGWEEFQPGGRLVRGIFNRVPPLRRFLKVNRPSYRGTIPQKAEILLRYKFSICYENLSGPPGYITEKIFDCFHTGCVPVYWGPPNVEEHIPVECFIDRTRFDRFEDVYAYLRRMPDEEYMAYRKAILDYLDSPRARSFSADAFAEALITHLV